MSDRDYYEILGLTPRADGTMVDQAYWHLARKYQALAETNPRAKYMLDELNEAYGVLGNPRLREQYDAFRDDVLIRRGMVQAVPARPEAVAASRRRERRARRLSAASMSTYGAAAAIIALAFAGAWQGVALSFVIPTLGGGLALALLPAVRRRVGEMDLHLPSLSLPEISMPEIQAPRLSVPSIPSLGDVASPAIRELGLGQRDEVIDADTLRASTAATIARWRQTVGLKPLATSQEPDRTLAEIVETERSLEANEDPFSSVMEILRGSQRHQVER
jgi:hypothetical protein